MIATLLAATEPTPDPAPQPCEDVPAAVIFFSTMTYLLLTTGRAFKSKLNAGFVSLAELNNAPCKLANLIGVPYVPVPPVAVTI